MNTILCSEIDHETAEGYFGKNVIIQENATGRTFPAKVVDYCFDDQKGFIVKIERSLVSDIIKKYDMLDAEYNGKDFVECDLRNTYNGKFFTLITAPRVFQ